MFKFVVTKTARDVKQFNRANFATKPMSEFEKDMHIMTQFQQAASANTDGKIHLDNAENMVRMLKEIATHGNEYPQGRKHIIAYARTQYAWADGADALFKMQIMKWSHDRKAAKKLASLGTTKN